MSKVIFLDVDGTLINYQTYLPKSAEKAVNEARRNGHRVYICTGCGKDEISHRDFRTMELDGMIGGNGVYVEDHDHVVYFNPLSADDTRDIVDWCFKRGLGVILESNAGMFVDDLFLKQGAEAMAKYASGKGKVIADIEEFNKNVMKQYTLLSRKELYRNDINKISYILGSYQDHLDAKRDFPHLVENTWGGKGEMALFGDIGPSGIDKKYAIKILLDYLNIAPKDTIAFGDANIDISMFEVCGYGVAMGNGGEGIKKAADYITDDVDHDGLYNAFKYLKLI